MDAVQLYQALSVGSKQELREAVSLGMTTMLPSRHFIRETMPFLSEWGVGLAVSGSRGFRIKDSSLQLVRIPEELVEHIKSTL